MRQAEWVQIALRHVRLMVLIAIASLLGNNVHALEPTLNPVDRALPDFSLQGVDGTLYQPKNLKGKTWLINFWAVWCAPCLDELPALNSAWSQLEKENVGMLAINIGEDAAKIEQFLIEHDLQIDFPIVVGDKIRTLGNWSGSGLPFTVIVSPAGKVVYEAVGPREWNEPRFVDAVVALNDTQSAQTVNARIASALDQFHQLSALLKVTIIAILLLSVAGLMILIRSLSKRNSTRSA